MEERSAPRKLTVILIADAVGFSRQMGEDEERALRVFNTRRGIIVAGIASHRGRVFGGAGDSVVAEFSSAVDAMKAAATMQAALAKLNEAAPDGERMLFRIGINLGDVIVERRNLFGDGVNVAERLQALAEPGGICVSGSVHEQVRDKLHFEFTDLGPRQLKNIAHPVRAFLVASAEGSPKSGKLGSARSPQRRLAIAAAFLAAVIAVTSGAYILRPWQYLAEFAAPSSGRPTIAVLPFANVSGDAGQDYLGDGISQDITSALSRFSQLAVLSANATLKFKGSDADSDELKHRLGARYVVAGNVRRNGDRIRVSVNLTDTDNKLQLWSRQFEREFTDIFAVQEEITRDITGSLAIKLTRIEQDRAFAKETDDLDAYDYLLRGWSAMATDARPNMFEARALFEKAIGLDPHYASAIAALGLTYYSEATGGWTEFPADALQRAETLARQAIALSPELGDAHQLLGLVYLARGEYDQGIVECTQAVEINPSDAWSHGTLGTILMWSGDAEGAIAAIEKAKVFDPTLTWANTLGFALNLVGRHEEALAVFESDLKPPVYWTTFVGLAITYAELGRTQDARQAVAEMRRLQPFFDSALFAQQWKDEKSRQLILSGLAKAGLS